MRAANHLQRRENYVCGTFSVESTREGSEFNHDSDLRAEQMQTISEEDCEKIFEECTNCSAWEWKELDEVERPNGHVQFFPGHCVVKVEHPPKPPQ